MQFQIKPVWFRQFQNISENFRPVSYEVSDCISKFQNSADYVTLVSYDVSDCPQSRFRKFRKFQKVSERFRMSAIQVHRGQRHPAHRLLHRPFPRQGRHPHRLPRSPETIYFCFDVCCWVQGLELRALALVPRHVWRRCRSGACVPEAQGFVGSSRPSSGEPRAKKDCKGNVFGCVCYFAQVVWDQIGILKHN